MQSDGQVIEMTGHAGHSSGYATPQGVPICAIPGRDVSSWNNAGGVELAACKQVVLNRCQDVNRPCLVAEAHAWQGTPSGAIPGCHAGCGGAASGCERSTDDQGIPQYRQGETGPSQTSGERLPP